MSSDSITQTSPLPTLYKRRSDGGAQQWTIEVDGNKYRTISGMVDGQLVTSEWTVCEGKSIGRANETTPEQQAMAEAQSKWQKKKDKSYHLDVDNVDNKTYFKPMLAHKYEDRKAKLTFPLYAQSKLDGQRCIATKDGLWSRNGKPIYGVPHIIEALKPLFAFNPDYIFDGELYNHTLKDNFNKIISMTRREKLDDEQIAESKKYIEYWVYDFPFWAGTFAERTTELCKVLSHCTSPSIIYLETVLTSDQSELDECYSRWLGDGYEGQIIRTVDGLYENKRSKNLLKRKEFQDKEYVIVDVEEGSGNRSGMAGRMTLRHPDGRTFNSNIKGGNDWYKKLLAEREELIGKEATVKFFQLTPDGIPRFPFVIRIRDYE